MIARVHDGICAHDALLGVSIRCRRMTNRARFAIDITLWLLVLVGGGIVGGSPIWS